MMGHLISLLPFAAALVFTIVVAVFYGAILRRFTSTISISRSSTRTRAFVVVRGTLGALVIWLSAMTRLFLVWNDVDRVAPRLASLGPPGLALVVDVTLWLIMISLLVRGNDISEARGNVLRAGLRAAIVPAVLFPLLYVGAYYLALSAYMAYAGFQW